MTKTISGDDSFLQVAPAVSARRPAHGVHTSSYFRSISTAIATRVRELIWQRAMRRLEGELWRLDDRMLKDIGMDRTEIRRYVLHGRDF